MSSVRDSLPKHPPDLLDRARQGDQNAWEVLFNECYPKIVRVIRRRMSRPLRKIYDSTDIANEVMKSLAAKFHYFDFSTLDGLQAFLVQAAKQKMVDGYRRGHAGKRDVTRDRALSAAVLDRFDLTDGSPTASQIAVATEEEEILLDGHTGEFRTILELKLQGCTNSEVSQTTGWHLRRIERFLQNLRGTWRF